ncbi:hypothetical protein [Shewanella sp. Isolate8]|uniref:hypothetical protein n=1 Tax=Shewanella sp. Isolate8 TaxID=2908529 RepID=UPI001EFC9CEB|nr:hypothetical protein [Shewanella sp. Isolate8]MCG9746612.1 hypothetical protein [Shewanella sp. Isolate8]
MTQGKDELVLRVLPKDSQPPWPCPNFNLDIDIDLDIDVAPSAFSHFVNEPADSQQAKLTEVPLAKGLLVRVGRMDLAIFLVVLFTHLALLTLLSWQFEGPYLQQSMPKDKKAISAYMLTQAELDAMRARSQPQPQPQPQFQVQSQVQSKPQSKLKPRSLPANASTQTPPKPTQSELDDSANSQRASTEEKPTPQGAVKANAALIKPLSAEEVAASRATDIEPITTQSTNPKTTDSKASQAVPKAETSDAHKEEKAFSFEDAPGLNLSSDISTDLSSDLGPAGEPISAYSGAVSAMTGDYMARDRQAQLDNLVQSAATNATQKKSMSEMDGDMRVLALPKENEYETAITLDSKVDPNRIVKIGDTCYRVVSVATPINPHGENLGFPFKCSGDKVKQAIKEGLDKHLSMMGVSQKGKN